MKIGFDVSQTGRLKAGCGYFADSLIRHLAQVDSENQYLLYPTFGDVYWDPDWSSETCRLPQANFRQAPGHKTFQSAQRFWKHPAPDLEMRLGNPDLIHANNFFCPKGLQKARLVYTLYDLSFLVNPEWTTEENRTGCFEGVFWASLHADFMISISHYSRHHFLEVFPHYPADRLIVVHPASRFSNPSSTPKPPKLPPLQPRQFWLNVGSREPRKNHHKLLQAFSLHRERGGSSFPLVLAGGQGWLMEDFEKAFNSLPLQGSVLSLGYVDDPTLQWLYQNCFAFIYPSLFEGFGLPVLEAMSLGAPVVASKVTSIPEIVGPAGILVDPTDEQAISAAMDTLVSDPGLHRNLREGSVQQAARFSWRSAAEKVLQTYQEVLRRDRFFSPSPGKQKQ